MDTIKKIEELVNKSAISKEDKDELIFLFSKAKDKDLSLILDLISENFNLVEVLNRDYKAKKSDSIDWQRIIKDEEKYLSLVD